MSAKKLPFEILQEIVSEMGVDQKPVNIGGNLFRPLVFQVNATGHYVFALVPITVEPMDAFDAINKQYDLYLDGIDTDIKFFRATDPSELHTLVIDWYINERQH